MLRTAATGVALTPLVTGNVAAHRPEPLDWYQHYVIDSTCEAVVIRDENPPDGNVFTMSYDRALSHIRNDHGWHEGEIRQFTAELRKLCLGVEPRQEVLDWYTHQVAGCTTTDDGRAVVIEDGLGYTFQVPEGFLLHHLEHDHGWTDAEIDEFLEALDHFCSH